MPYLNRLRLENSLIWQQYQFINDVLTLEQGDTTSLDNFATGTGINQFNIAYFNTGTLASGETRRIDLINLNKNFFGQTGNINLSGDNIKLCYLKNNNTGVGHDLFLCATGEAGFTHLLGYSYLGRTIKPNTYTIFYDKYYGFPVDADHRYLYLWDMSGTGITYQLGLFGVSFE